MNRRHGPFECRGLSYFVLNRRGRLAFIKVFLQSSSWHLASKAAPLARKARNPTPFIETILSMRHPRVRRPFIVESRGSTRDGSTVAIPKRVPPSPQIQAKAAAELARPLFDPWAAVTAPPEPAAAARRILPNLMTPPEPVPVEPEAEAPISEPPLPRVRRVKPKAAAAPRPAASRPGAPRPAAPIEAPAPVARPAATVEIIKPDIAAAPALRIPLRSDRTGRAALPAGQRWKARLPRACW